MPITPPTSPVAEEEKDIAVVRYNLVHKLIEKLDDWDGEIYKITQAEKNYYEKLEKQTNVEKFDAWEKVLLNAEIFAARLATKKESHLFGDPVKKRNKTLQSHWRTLEKERWKYFTSVVEDRAQAFLNNKNDKDFLANWKKALNDLLRYYNKQVSNDKRFYFNYPHFFSNDQIVKPYVKIKQLEDSYKASEREYNDTHGCWSCCMWKKATPTTVENNVADDIEDLPEPPYHAM